MDPEQIKQLQAQFQQISNDLASGKPDKVKAAQTQLQALGFDINPDGRLGGKTSAAIGKLRQTISDAQSNIATTADARAREAANDPVNRLTKLGTEVGPYAAGGLIGYGISRKMSQGNTLADADLKQSVSRIAGNPEVRPDIAKSELGRLKRGRMARTLKQTGVPGAFFAGAEATRRLVAPQFEDPATREAVNLIATGEQGAGLTLGVKQLADLARRGSPVDPEDEAVIKSRAANVTRPLQSVAPSRPLQTISSTPLPAPASIPAPEVAAQPPAPQPAAPDAGERLPNAQRMKMAAEAVRGTVRTGLKKEAYYNMMKRGLNPENMASVARSFGLPETVDRKTILAHARSILKTSSKSGILLPFAAGAMAVDALRPAEAADGTQTDPTAGEQAAAFGLGAGLYEGGRRIMQAIPPVASGALAAGGAMALPNELSNAMEGTPEQMNMARNKAARYIPESMQFGAVDQARQMAQVPERNPLSQPIDMSMQNAANLEIPSMGEFPEAIDADIARAYRKSPRRTIIELSRSSGLDPEDIAMLAGVSAEDVSSVMQAIPQQALAAR